MSLPITLAQKLKNAFSTDSYFFIKTKDVLWFAIKPMTTCFKSLKAMFDLINPWAATSDEKAIQDIAPNITPHKQRSSSVVSLQKEHREAMSCISFSSASEYLLSSKKGEFKEYHEAASRLIKKRIPTLLKRKEPLDVFFVKTDKGEPLGVALYLFKCEEYKNVENIFTDENHPQNFVDIEKLKENFTSLAREDINKNVGKTNKYGIKEEAVGTCSVYVGFPKEATFMGTAIVNHEDLKFLQVSFMLRDVNQTKNIRD